MTAAAFSRGQDDWESFISFLPLLIFLLLRAEVCYAIQPSRSHVITMLSKWCQAVGLQWVMGVRSPSAVHDMTGAAGVQVKWTAFWQRAEELSMAACVTTPAQKTTHVREIVFAESKEPSCVSSTMQFAVKESYENQFWNRCWWFPIIIHSDVLWVIWKCVPTSGYHCLLRSASFSILIWTTCSNPLWPGSGNYHVVIGTAWKLLVEIFKKEKTSKREQWEAQKR